MEGTHSGVRTHFLVMVTVLQLCLWLSLKKKLQGFPGGSDGKESICNARDLGSVPGLGRFLEECMATYSSILAWRIPTDRGDWWATVHGVTKSQTRLSN